MKIDVITIDKDDLVMVKNYVGNMPIQEVDRYSKKVVHELDSIFGKGRIVFFPIRNEHDWDFTIIKKPHVENIKKVAPKWKR